MFCFKTAIGSRYNHKPSWRVFVAVNMVKAILFHQNISPYVLTVLFFPSSVVIHLRECKQYTHIISHYTCDRKTFELEIKHISGSMLLTESASAAAELCIEPMWMFSIIHPSISKYCNAICLHNVTTSRHPLEKPRSLASPGFCNFYWNFIT